jgi:hypothetical protein
MPDEPKPKTRIIQLPFELPIDFGEPIAWLAIVMDGTGRTFLRGPMDALPGLSLFLAGEAVRLVNGRVARAIDGSISDARASIHDGGNA